MNPYFIMAILYVSLAVLAALESSFSGLQLVPWFNGMVWLRVHLITLGVMTQLLFSLMPYLTAVRYRLPKPPIRWDIWLALNGGIMTLLVGIPLVSKPPIFVGGTLVFIAVVLLIQQLHIMKPSEEAQHDIQHATKGRKFYIAGLAYFLVGITVGTGLWIGWMEPLGVQDTMGAHIHSNSWGLMSLVFTGLLIDMYPTWTKRPFANPQSITPIFWLMTLGAFGLIFGPWFGTLYLTVPGLIMHLISTFWLLYNVIKPLRGDKAAWIPGMWHIVLSYIWFVGPLLFAPLILLEVPGVPGAAIEAAGPQIMVYGFLLQFGFSVIPYFFSRLFLPEEEATLGGTWFTVALMNGASALPWFAVLIPAIDHLYGVLFSIAYLIWAVATVPIAITLWRTTKAGLARFENGSVQAL
jgi:cytochrome c oxidase cbb3-type subunit I